jgi:hypothetical protein
VQGGKFEHGFLAGFISSGVSSMHLPKNLLLNTVVAATVGGTTEAIGGGKFLNGAVTGAYVFLMNHAAHTPPDELINLILASATFELSKSGFECELPYALAFVKTVAEATKKELAAWQTDDGCAFVQPWDKNTSDVSTNEYVNNRDGTYSYNGKRIVAQWHYGPTKYVGQSSEPGLNDPRLACRLNIYVTHMTSTRYYCFSPGPLALFQCASNNIPNFNPWFIYPRPAISKQRIKL